jgi:hypothetical protein
MDPPWYDAADGPVAETSTGLGSFCTRGTALPAVAPDE